MTSAIVDDTVQWATNPKTVAQAIAYAENEVRLHRPIWFQRCLAFVGTCYGIPFTGTAYAIDMWSQVPASVRHTSAGNIPAGALLVYDTGKRAGHIALHAGGGQVYSNDIKGNGYIAKVHFNDLTDGTWRLKYLGWIPPYFPRNAASKLSGTTQLGSVTGSVGNVVDISDSTGVTGGTVPVIDELTGLIDDLKENWINGLMAIVGLILILLALWRITGGTTPNLAKTITKAAK